MRFTSTDEAAFDAFFAALEAQGPDKIETYYDRDTDKVDGNGSEVVNALLAAGWAPPTALRAECDSCGLEIKRRHKADLGPLCDECAIEADSGWENSV
jgi:hypothetical protein